MTKPLAVPWLRPTTRVERALQDAQEHARQAGFGLVQSGHLLLALVQEPQSFSTLLLGRLGVSPQDIQAEVERLAADAQPPAATSAALPGRGDGSRRPPDIRLSPPPARPRTEFQPTEMALADNRAQMLDAGRREAQDLGDTYVGTEHLLLALIPQGGISGEALRRLGVTSERARAALSDLKA